MHIGWTSAPIGFRSSVRKAPPILEGEELFAKWEAAGHFWLPERPEEKLWGRASFVPGYEVVVVLEGSFRAHHPSRGGIECAALNGVLFNGAHCTVFDLVCHVELYFSDKEYLRSTLRASLLLLGGHFSSIGEVRLQSMNVRFSHLDNWFQEPFDLRYKKGGFEKALVCFSPDAFEVKASFEREPFTLSLFCQREIPLSSSLGKLEFGSRYALVAEPSSAKPLSWFFSLASSLRSFLMLLIGCGIYTLQLVGELPDTFDRSPSDSASPASVRIYLPATIPMVVQTDANFFSSLYSELSSDFAAATRGWLEHREIIETATRAYTEVLQNDGATEESVFLRVVQTLEHLHGIIFPGPSRYLPPTAWESFRAWLAENVPDPLPGLGGEDDAENERVADQRTIILSRIESLNKLSFRSRLEMLFREIPGSTLTAILDYPHPSVDESLADLLRTIEATRNYLTHYEKRQAKKALKGKDLERATAKCWAVLTYWLATYIGFSAENSRNIAVKAKRRAMFLVARKTEL